MKNTLENIIDYAIAGAEFNALAAANLGAGIYNIANKNTNGSETLGTIAIAAGVLLIGVGYLHYDKFCKIRETTKQRLDKYGWGGYLIDEYMNSWRNKRAVRQGANAAGYLGHFEAYNRVHD